MLQKFSPEVVQKGSAVLQLLLPFKLVQGVGPEQLVQVIVVVQQLVAVPQLELVFQET